MKDLIRQAKELMQWADEYGIDEISLVTVKIVFILRVTQNLYRSVLLKLLNLTPVQVKKSKSKSGKVVNRV